MVRKRSRTVVTSHLEHISRALLDGEKRLAFLEFLKQNNERRGVYALYDANGNIFYVGKASDLQQRLTTHLTDKLADK